MDTIILDKISFEIDKNFLFESLHIKENSSAAGKLSAIADYAQTITRPKAAYRLSSVEFSEDGCAVVDGVKLNSHIVRVNLKDVKRAFPFLVTCGGEIEQWSNGFDSILESYWIDTIKMMAIGAAFNAFGTHLEETFQAGPTSSMNPGSLDDWPIEEQGKIFTILGDSCKTIGVELTETFMMIPLKSVSGLQFSSDEKFVNCQLCPRKDCPMRRAPYDEHLYVKKYQNKGSDLHS